MSAAASAPRATEATRLARNRAQALVLRATFGQLARRLSGKLPAAFGDGPVTRAAMASGTRGVEAVRLVFETMAEQYAKLCGLECPVGDRGEACERRHRTLEAARDTVVAECAAARSRMEPFLARDGVPRYSKATQDLEDELEARACC